MSVATSYETRHAEATRRYAASLLRTKNTPEPAGQKFSCGARVRIADDLGPCMSHFPSGRLATVVYTYAHAYGGDDVQSYCLDVDDVGEVSWYREHQLTQLPQPVRYIRAGYPRS